MAQRGAWTPQKVRDRIRTSMLVKRLQDDALGKIKLDQGRRRSIEILLNKTLANLSSEDITHKGDPAHPIMVSQTDSNL